MYFIFFSVGLVVGFSLCALIVIVREDKRRSGYYGRN